MFVLGNFIYAIATIIDYLLTAINWLIIIRVLLSWVNPDPYNAVVRFLYSITEPILAPFRRIVPVYSMAVDFSPVFALIAVWFLRLFLVRTLFGIAARMG
jgi:YggT family protein